MIRLTLESFDKWIDFHIEDFKRQYKDNHKIAGYHNSPGQGMDIGWIECARFIKDNFKEDFEDFSL
jgi:hypothetical protein